MQSSPIRHRESEPRQDKTTSVRRETPCLKNFRLVYRESRATLLPKEIEMCSLATD